METAGIVISALLVIAGWLVNGYFARKLQRKQLAVNVLFGVHENEALISSMQAVFKKLNSDHNYDWKKLAQCRYDKQPCSQDEEKLGEHVTNVLNHFESLSIAVLNKAVDNDVIKWSKQSMINRLYQNISPFIEEARRLLHDKKSWCYFEQLAKQWTEVINPVRPTG